MDKVGTYDKEQLQAMGWLFDEIETPDTAVRFVEQDLTSEQQMQVFKNLGWDVYVTDSKSFLGSTLTPEEIERFKVMSAIILTDLNKIFLYGSKSGDFIRFYGMVNNTQFGGININPSTGYVSGVGAYRFLDPESVHFTKQTLTIPQQNTALSNIGLDFVHVDYSLLGTILDDSTAALVENAKGIILTNTPENYSKASVFLKSNYSNDLIYFNAWNGVSLVSQFYYNTNTKKSTAISDTDLRFASIRYDVSQGLTNTQKQRARSNIGVQSADELLEDADFIAQLKTKLGL